MVKVAFLLVVVCAVLVDASPATIPNANFPEAARKVNDLHYIMMDDETAVNVVAHGDNPEVDAIMAPKIRATGVVAERIVREMLDKCTEETLSRAEAEAYFDQMGELFAQMQEDLMVDVILLSIDSQATIPMIFNAGATRAAAKAEELFALLD